MAKYDIYQSSGGGDYLLILQDEILDNLSTQVVAPLVASDEAPIPMKNVNPIIALDGGNYVLMTHLLAAIHASSLKRKVGSAKGQRDEIIAALDFLFTGF